MNGEIVLKFPNTSLASIKSFRDCARQLAALLALGRETLVSPAWRSARCWCIEEVKFIAELKIVGLM